MNTNEQLKPCPFCGSGVHLEYPIVVGNDRYYRVVCDNCPATIGFYETEAEVIKVWNRRNTGVPDKNDKIMYTGDTVKGLFLWGKEILSTVAFENGSFGLKWMRGDIEEFYPFTSMCNVQYEIVEQEGE